MKGRRVVIALLGAAAFACASAPFGGEASSPGALARRQVQAALARDWATLRQIYAPTVQYVDPDGAHAGREAAIEHLDAQLAPFEPVTLQSLTVYEGKDFAVAEWTATATNSHPLTLPDGHSVPATGRKLSFSVLTLYEVKGGQIVSERSYWDNLALYGQLELLDE